MSAPNPIKILMLEDSPEDIILIERVLKKSRLPFISKIVDTRDEFTDSIRNFVPDVVLSDHVLPGFNSIEALEISLREKAKTPFILVSGTSNELFAVSCLRKGAADYISKSDLTRLPAAIREALKKNEQTKKKREARNKVRREFRKLQASKATLDTFVYTVSHNLRGPITTLLGLLNVVRQTDDLPSLRALHDLMQTSISKMDNTVIGLLEHERNMHQPVNIELIDWSEIINKIFSRLEYLDSSHAVTKSVHLETAVPFHSDSERIAPILCNVISNAVIYRNKLTGHESTVSVEIFTSIESAIITIRDNGVGISAELLPNVFNIFFRGSTSPGTGLGLYITKQAVNKLQGTIDITSYENAGTTVRIEIPNALSIQDVKTSTGLSAE